MYTGPNPFNRIEGERQQREGQEREERGRDFNAPPPGRKRSPYRLHLLIGAVGVLLIVLGFVIPGWQWLIFVGAVLFFAAAFTVRLWFVEGWIPTLFANKGPGNDHLPPPPTGDWRS